MLEELDAGLLRWTAAVLCCKLMTLHWVCNQQQLTHHRGYKRNLQPTSQALLIPFTKQRATAAMPCTNTQLSIQKQGWRCLQDSVQNQELGARKGRAQS